MVQCSKGEVTGIVNSELGHRFRPGVTGSVNCIR